jgi:hypothetical protein
MSYSTYCTIVFTVLQCLLCCGTVPMYLWHLQYQITGGTSYTSCLPAPAVLVYLWHLYSTVYPIVQYLAVLYVLEYILCPISYSFYAIPNNQLHPVLCTVGFSWSPFSYKRSSAQLRLYKPLQYLLYCTPLYTVDPSSL